MTMRVQIAHVDLQSMRRLEVQECDRQGDPSPAKPVIIIPGAQHEFLVWEGLTLRVRELPLPPVDQEIA